MKRHSLLLLTALLTSATLIVGCSGSRTAAVPAGADDPSVVAVIDGEPLTLDEFETRYARASGGAAVAADDSLEAYRDFLQRYVNFRVKVKAARDAGLDESDEVLSEIRTYRTNLARPYLIEREVLEPLVREVYDRRQETIDASHILIRVGPVPTPADTLAAYEKLVMVLDSVRAGTDFGDLAVRHSEDPSAQREGRPGYRGRLGFFEAGRMVQEFEDVAYETPVGEVSDIFRTQFGYHILQVNERRENVAPVQVAHIMIVPASPLASGQRGGARQDRRHRFATGARGRFR